MLAAAVDAPALVVLGPPGCGKSTLLRRLELDLAYDALRAAEGKGKGQGEGEGQGTGEGTGEGTGAARAVGGVAADGWVSFFVPLNRYRPARAGEALPSPDDWLAAEWERRTPHLPPLADFLRRGRALLLLDAVNEIPHSDAADYAQRIDLWRDFLARLPHGVRAIFSCRRLDYSASLSTPERSVPHVRIEQLADRQVEDFLAAYSPTHGADLWSQLRGTPQLDLFRSPFYLRLLIAQAGEGGPPLRGRAALFTGFVRQALLREIEAGNRLFRPGYLLDARDHAHIVRREWRNALELPTRGPLLPALSRLAHALQAHRAPGQASRVRVPWDDACELLSASGGGVPAAELLCAGSALQVLEEQWDDLLYVHQLLQEYFAARWLAAHPQAELAASEWRAATISPSLDEVIAGLGDADALPELPPSGWEETFVLAAALTPRADDFVAALGVVNLPLAGRCAAQPDVAVSDPLRRRLQDELIARSRDPAADLRARIAAARALGELGDPRYERRRGPHGTYLLPPLVSVAAGRYPLGSDEGIQTDEAPAHRVSVAAFAIARFALSNAEWRLFIEAGGYDDERWWEGEAAQAWHRGEGTADGPKQQWRDNRRWAQDNLAAVRRMPAEGRLTSQQLADWEKWCAMSDSGFEQLLDRSIPSGRQTEPAYWNDPAYNDPAQPVVG
ncbi:MAG TPA: SUMF1/EgtB/PvdO family nonheme iron enzyme, partial [Accumulibacter sp.]|uniref:NACHT domain-containing protein n=1 Tax=Accumulibacter sp. TaxID=2053492 RepID=UPI002C1C4D64